MDEYLNPPPILPPESNDLVPQLPPIPEPAPQPIVVSKPPDIRGSIKLVLVIIILAGCVALAITQAPKITSVFADFSSRFPFSDMLSTFTKSQSSSHFGTISTTPTPFVLPSIPAQDMTIVPSNTPVPTPTYPPAPTSTPIPTQVPQSTSSPTPAPTSTPAPQTTTTPTLSGINGPYDWGSQGTCFTIDGDQVHDNGQARPFGFTWKLDDNGWSSYTDNEAIKCYTGMSTGSHTVYAKVKNPAGNESNQVSTSFFK